MSITAQEFDTEHFDKLIRGLKVAKEAFVHRKTMQAPIDPASVAVREEIATLTTQRDALIEVAQDVSRGLATLDELLELAKEMTR